MWKCNVRQLETIALFTIFLLSIFHGRFSVTIYPFWKYPAKPLPDSLVNCPRVVTHDNNPKNANRIHVFFHLLSLSLIFYWKREWPKNELRWLKMRSNDQSTTTSRAAIEKTMYDRLFAYAYALSWWRINWKVERHLVAMSLPQDQLTVCQVKWGRRLSPNVFLKSNLVDILCTNPCWSKGPWEFPGDNCLIDDSSALSILIFDTLLYIVSFVNFSLGLHFIARR